MSARRGERKARERIAGEIPPAEMRRRLALVERLLAREFGRPEPFREEPLGCLVGTILSQSTNSANSGGQYRALRRRWRRWGEVADAPARSVEKVIRSGGLAREKARRIRAALRELRRRFGRVTLAPVARMSNAEALDFLRSLPGVGQKTAACVLLFALGRNVNPVDTHIRRIFQRLGLVGGRSTAEEASRLTAPFVPRGRALALHLNLIRLGRTICRARAPGCGKCPLRARCRFALRGREKGSPRATRRGARA